MECGSVVIVTKQKSKSCSQCCAQEEELAHERPSRTSVEMKLKLQLIHLQSHGTSEEVIKPETVVMLRLVPLGLAVQRENAGILVNRKLLSLEIWMRGMTGLAAIGIDPGHF